PPKRPDAYRLNAIELYARGESIRQIAGALGVSTGWVASVLRAGGVRTRSLSSARLNFFTRGGEPSRQRKDLPVDELASRYLSGESANALAKEFNASHCAISERLQ